MFSSNNPHPPHHSTDWARRCLTSAIEREQVRFDTGHAFSQMMNGNLPFAGLYLFRNCHKVARHELSYRHLKKKEALPQHNCAHIHCLVSAKVQQPSMIVIGCILAEVGAMDEFHWYISASYTILPDCYLWQGHKSYGLLPIPVKSASDEALHSEMPLYIYIQGDHDVRVHFEECV